MTHIFRIISLLALATIVPVAGAFFPPTEEMSSPAKVSTWVLDATSDGQETDLLIVMNKQADLGAAYALPTKEARGRYVHDLLWNTARQSQASLRDWLDKKGVSYQSFYIVNLIHVQAANRSMVEAIAKRTDVERIDANPMIHNPFPIEQEGVRLPTGTGIESNISHVGAPQVWNLGFTGQNVVVGGQDTGYDWDHPALVNQYRGWNGTSADHDYNWHDAIHENNPNTGFGNPCGFDSAEPCDDDDHGTHTMGTVLGDDGSTHQIGMAPGAQWIGCRNMEQRYGTPATYLECFEFFLAPYPVGGDPSQGKPDMAPDVTNNSWSCPPSEGCNADTLLMAVNAQRAAGIMTVTSAGNTGPSCSTVQYPPAIYDASYTIGATYLNDALVSFSSHGPVTVDGSNRIKPDLVAPGSSIYSSFEGGGYGYMSGTSMASPHVAGAVALLWSAAPSLLNQVTRTEDILNNSAVSLYSTACGGPQKTIPNNSYGWGRLDILASVYEAITPTIGYLSGMVEDEWSVPLSGIDILVNDGDSGWIVESGQDGSYRLPIHANTYTVTVEKEGYDPIHIPAVEVTEESTTYLDLTLTLICEEPVLGEVSIEPVSPLVGETVTLSATIAAGEPPFSFTWDFGDQSATSTSNPATHAYSTASSPTNYTVTLTLDNRCHEPDVRKFLLEVIPLDTMGILSGTVRDDEDSILTDVRVDALLGQEHTWTTTTNQDGIYSMQLLSGTYTLTLDLPGFQRKTLAGITVTDRETTTLEHILEPLCIAPQSGGIMVTPPEPIVGKTATLSATLTGGTLPITATWQLGDGGSIQMGYAITHTFPITNSTLTYAITLTLENQCPGSPVLVQDSIRVRPHRLMLPLVFKK